MKKLLLFSTIFLLLISSTLTYATTVYDNGGTPINGGGIITYSLPVDDFQLYNDSLIRGSEIILYYLDENVTWNQSVEWMVFNDNMGKPGDIINSGVASNIEEIRLNLTHTKYSFDFGKRFYLEANQKYWIGLHAFDVDSGWASLSWSGKYPRVNSNNAQLRLLNSGLDWNTEVRFKIVGSENWLFTSAEPYDMYFKINGKFIPSELEWDAIVTTDESYYLCTTLGKYLYFEYWFDTDTEDDYTGQIYDLLALQETGDWLFLGQVGTYYSSTGWQSAMLEIPQELWGLETEIRFVLNDYGPITYPVVFLRDIESSAVPALSVISPNGREELSAGETFEITWASKEDIENIKIEYSANNGTDWVEVIESTENDGSYDWEIPCEISTDCLVRISDVDSDVSDVSDAVFAIYCQLPPDIEAIIDFFDESVADGTLKGFGKRQKTANFRLWLMGKMLETAQSFIEKEKMKAACRTLNRALLHCDSEPKPKDFIKGPAVPILADMISDLMNNLSGLQPPSLQSPQTDAVLDNGCDDLYNRSDTIEWNFSWLEVPGATQYQIYVIGENALNPVIDAIVTSPSYNHSCPECYIVEHHRYNWSWKVRFGNDEGEWSEWSEIRYFNVEPVNTDCSNVDVLIVTTTLLDNDQNFNTIVNEYQNVLKDKENLGVKYVEVDSEECFLAYGIKVIDPGDWYEIRDVLEEIVRISGASYIIIAGGTNVFPRPSINILCLPEAAITVPSDSWYVDFDYDEIVDEGLAISRLPDLNYQSTNVVAGLLTAITLHSEGGFTLDNEVRFTMNDYTTPPYGVCDACTSKQEFFNLMSTSDYIVFTGHGNPTGFYNNSFEPIFTINYMSSVDLASYHPVIIGYYSCNTAIVWPSSPTLSSEFLKAGASAFVATTTTAGVPTIIADGFPAGILGGARIGDALFQLMRETALTMSCSFKASAGHISLYGDPTLKRHLSEEDIGGSQ